MDLNKYKYKKFGEWLRKQRGSRSQLWLADKCGLSTNFISEIENGKKRPSAINVGMFAAMFDGDIKELAEMTDWKRRDVNKGYKVVIGIRKDISRSILQAKVEILNAHTLRNAGATNQAIVQLCCWIKILENCFLSTHGIKDKHEIIFVFIRILIECMACNSETIRRDMVVNAMIDDHATVLSLANFLNDKEGKAMANSWLAGGYYVAREYTKAVEYANKALPFIKNDPTLRAETLRGLMLDYAYLDQSDDFLRIERNAFEDLDHGIITAHMDIAAIFDGSGRGRAILKKPYVESHLDKAEKETKKFNEQMMIKPLRSLQIFCSRLIAFTKYREQGLSFDVQNAAEIAYRGHCLAKSFGYERHAREIERLRRKLKIPPF